VAVLGAGRVGHSPSVLLQLSSPSFVATHDFSAKITQIPRLISLRFQILEKWANFRLSLNVQKPKVLQL